MLSSQTLDVIIGLSVVFLTVSLVCSSVNELLAAALSRRANFLQTALHSLVGGSLAQAIINHPVVPAAQNGGDKRPSYIEPTLFATALLDELTKNVPAPTAAAAELGVPLTTSQFAHANAAVAGPKPSAYLAHNPALQHSLTAFLSTANGDYDKLRQQVSTWFNAYMDRVGGVYKRQSQAKTAIIALAVAVILNVDTLKVYRQLTTQPAFAATVAAKADLLLKESTFTQVGQKTTTLADPVKSLNNAVATISIPIGWDFAHLKSEFDSWPKTWQKLIGLLLTAIAASLGAPFWFDVLGKVANLRSTGGKPRTNSASSST